MPFLKGGRQAVTRTLKYLNAGRTVFRENVKVVLINHLPGMNISHGADEFIKFFLPPIQFKNPEVQVLTYKNLSPHPYVQIFLSNGEEVLVNCSFRTHNEIHEHIRNTFGKTEEELQKESIENQVILNPAYFGKEYKRQCICEVYDQSPCSASVGKPKPWPNLTNTAPFISEEIHAQDTLHIKSVNEEK
ncbi:28S ribosomal protein S25, mitochondrial [Cichlidogyrus casuarinus]|uniref:Small ribosomal subunit protein mS25 n=1 Tax=Cichlidogyrus casuarinus TaxID=1844966 RepID=A0ABD2Q5H7_9PLAT